MFNIATVRTLVLPLLVGTLKAGDPRNAVIPHNTLSRRMRKMMAACEPRPPRFHPRSMETEQQYMAIRYAE